MDDLSKKVEIIQSFESLIFRASITDVVFFSGNSPLSIINIEEDNGSFEITAAAIGPEPIIQ